VSIRFGDNRCGSDREVDPVPFKESVLGYGNVWNDARVDQQMVRFYWERFDRPTHGEQCGMINVETVDFANFRQPNTDGCCRAADYGFHFDSLVDVEPLGIVNPGELSTGWKHDRRRYYRSGKGPNPYLVDACNGLDARLPEHALEIQHVEHSHSIGPLLLVTFFEELVNFSGTLTRIAP